MWRKDPAFLQLSADKWPKHETLVSAEHVEKRITKNPPVVSHVFVDVALGSIPVNLERIIDPKHSSSHIQLPQV